MTDNRSKTAGEPVLLSGGNPQIAKGYGDAPVQAWIAAAPGWKSAAARQIDALIETSVPGVRKAVKWNSPFYGAPDGEGWFLSLHAFTKYLKVGFFRGVALEPVPLASSKHAEMRYLHVSETEPLDEAQCRAALRQQAGERGVVLADDVIDFMLVRFARDMGSLMRLLARLDRFALQQQRAITVPLLRAMLQDQPPVPQSA